MSVAKGEASGDEFALCVSQYTLAWFEKASSGALMCGIVMKDFVAYTVDQGGAQNDVFVNIAASLCGYLQVVGAAGPLMSLLEAKGPRKLVNASELMFLDRLLVLGRTASIETCSQSSEPSSCTLEILPLFRALSSPWKFQIVATATRWILRALAQLSCGMEQMISSSLMAPQLSWLIKTLPFRIEPVADALSWLLENTTNNDDFLHHADSYAYLNVMQNFNQSRLSAFVSQQQPIFHVTFAAADLATRDLFSSYSCQYRAYAAGRDGTLGTLTSVPFVSPKIPM
ncbi:hypothetical protein MCOR27_008475 [Pyricularia oryzae]|nr:hypothetical protein MCOR02_011439 [Pyricularia oryzae]KAI6272142.1 hypothetical protein MCOR27_008475 [Pyricularia oryzae]KAI6400803.1 hypothetical protein MCOR20_008341 [Pyricularia oryzae]KAI6612465.1 hypothetical protein MCOR07_009726 [Pyricularia oryzae]